MWKWNWVARIRFEHRKSIDKWEWNRKEETAERERERNGNSETDGVEKSNRDRLLVELINY